MNKLTSLQYQIFSFRYFSNLNPKIRQQDHIHLLLGFLILLLDYWPGLLRNFMFGGIVMEILKGFCAERRLTFLCGKETDFY